MRWPLSVTLDVEGDERRLRLPSERLALRAVVRWLCAGIPGTVGCAALE
jgi:hypothetical protein